jgi:hypothetical protein
MARRLAVGHLSGTIAAAWHQRLDFMTTEPSPERRRHPRTAASWPVVVETDGEAIRLETINLSRLGAKASVTDRLREGASVVLHFQPPAAPSVDVWALVWRVDPDGLVFFFVGELQ